MSDYPQYLAERDYYEDIIGSEILEPEEINDIYPPLDVQWIGDKPQVHHEDETIEDQRIGEE